MNSLENPHHLSPALNTSPPAKVPLWAPAATLLLLAPLIAEVLFGATRISVIFVLIPEIMVWGCGALLVREAVARWRAGRASMILLGLALAMAEECVIQQTSLAPLVGAQHVYGRYFGVNWVYLLALLIYECVWVVLVPVEITELIYDRVRGQPWLKVPGLVISGAVFVVGSFIAWFLWTQRARPMVFHVPKYNPPARAIAIALACIMLLVFLAYRLRGFRLARPLATRYALHPSLLGVAGCLLSIPCFMLTVVAYGGSPNLPPWILLAGGIVYALISLLLVRRWASSADFSELHRFALAFGALIANMSAGFMVLAAGALMIDWIGKSLLNVIAVVLMVMLGRRIRRRIAPLPS